MITAFGTGIHEDFDISKLRYHKIIIMTDADVDGAYCDAALTFLYRFMPELIKAGICISGSAATVQSRKKNKSLVCL